MFLLHRIGVLLLPALLLLTGPARAEIVLTDIAGRTVTLPETASRLLIDDGRYLIALALLDPDPVSLLSAWPRDVNRIGPAVFEAYRAAFPAIEDLARVESSAGTFSLEQVLAVAPDAAVFSLGHGPTAEQAEILAGAGIPVVFIDFFVHPFANLEPSLRLLGQLVGREDEADAFIAFRQEHLDRIAEALAATPGAAVPPVFLEVHAGLSEECCNAPGRGNVGDYIELVGGHNIGADVLPGPYGRLNLEYVLAADPAVYIATGGPHLEQSGGLVLGPGYTAEVARASLARVAARPGIAEIGAVKAGRVHGLAHQLLNSPLDIVAVEALARWIRPDLFAELDPGRTLDEISTRFLAVPLDGTFWIDL